MTSVWRVLFPDFKPPATFGSAGIRPAETPKGADMELVDRAIQLLQGRHRRRR